MTVFILKYLFLFGTGSLFGWILELFYRRYFGKAKDWINPGFLSGPYLPIYGTGVSVLYIVSDLNINFAIKIILFAIFTTLIEYITGLFFLKYYNARLWDYSNLKFNINGLVSPLYSFFWTILSLFFYYVLYPYFYNQIEFLYQNLQFSLFVGILYGIIIVDVNNSFNILIRVKELTETIEESSVVIHLEDFKREIKFKYVNIKSKTRKPQFLLPFKGVNNLKGHVKDYIGKLKDENVDDIKRINRF
ncbi:putative ABC transporter permease [Clostridiaceae bacterium HSG29]|nr:putative ABC transporter permease [Clostridiaceae bacterium HSG29]